MNELALFAGAGGGILGGHLLGWRTICAVEWSEFPRESLLRRQQDGALPRFPIWDDVQTFDGRPWAGLVDVVSGGFPCQDISAAGKAAGIDGERSGMWSHMARIIGEVRPRFAFVENSPMLTSRGLGRVLGDLAEMGFDAEWGVLGAIDAGAPHIRDRIWVVAHNPSAGWGAWRARRPDPSGTREREYALQEPADMADADRELLNRSRTPGPTRRAESANSGEVGDAHGERRQEFQLPAEPDQARFAGWRCDAPMGNSDGLRELQQEGREREERGWPGDAGWWSAEPRLGRVAHELAAGMDEHTTNNHGDTQ